MDKYLVSSKGPVASTSKRTSAAGGSGAPSAQTTSKGGGTSLLPIHGGIRKQNQHTLKNLKTESNVITMPKHYEYIHSNATGHQNGGGHSTSWRLSRNTKLKRQGAEKEGNLFKGVVAYINGYTGAKITNLALIALIQTNGGEIRYNLSGSCTHVFTTQGLSGKKTQAFLNSKASGMKVVHPDWATESARLGKRQPEAKFAVVQNEGQESVRDGLTFQQKRALDLDGEDSPAPSKRSKLVAVKHVSAYDSPADVIYAEPELPSLAQFSKQPLASTSSLSKSRTRSKSKSKSSPQEARKEFAPSLKPITISSSPPPESDLMAQPLSRSSSTSSTVSNTHERPSTLEDEPEEEEEDDDEEELDEYGMPPSAQRQRR